MPGDYSNLITTTYSNSGGTLQFFPAPEPTVWRTATTVTTDPRLVQTIDIYENTDWPWSMNVIHEHAQGTSRHARRRAVKKAAAVKPVPLTELTDTLEQAGPERIMEFV